QGAPEAVAAIIAWARRGPQAAQVDHVDVCAGEGGYTTFDRLPTH
ncbi:MAG TPA: acylphosphatase, partial [Betaproteobacteria bacterium]|nr:acylphosphatase [Betaproteobacteria bacterium]